MQNIRLNAKAAYELMEKLRDVLDANEDEHIRDVCIMGGDDTKDPMNEVEVHVSLVAVCTGVSKGVRMNLMDTALDAARRECEMRADDNLKLCKEIDALNAKLAAVRDRLAVAVLEA